MVAQWARLRGGPLDGEEHEIPEQMALIVREYRGRLLRYRRRGYRRRGMVVYVYVEEEGVWTDPRWPR